jgi:hypothetical protein
MRYAPISLPKQQPHPGAWASQPRRDVITSGATIDPLLRALARDKPTILLSRDLDGGLPKH